MGNGIGYSKKDYNTFKDSLHDCNKDKYRPCQIKEKIHAIIKEKKSMPQVCEISGRDILEMYNIHLRTRALKKGITPIIIIIISFTPEHLVKDMKAVLITSF